MALKEESEESVEKAKQLPENAKQLPEKAKKLPKKSLPEKAKKLPKKSLPEKAKKLPGKSLPEKAKQLPKKSLQSLIPNCFFSLIKSINRPRVLQPHQNHINRPQVARRVLDSLVVANVPIHEDTPSDVVVSSREVAPSHYLLRIESFSSLTDMLSQGKTKGFQSEIFRASGYKWRFCVFPNEGGSDKGHISVLLHLIVGKSSSKWPQGWVINTDLKFFIHDQLRDKYIIFKDGEVNRFHRQKTECGIAKLVSRAAFEDVSNGYLVHDKCAFGVEVFVIDISKCLGEYLRPPLRLGETFRWTVSKFNKLGSKVRFSGTFTAASIKWRLKLYPRGDCLRSSNIGLSLYVERVDPQPNDEHVLMQLMLRIRDQKSEKHREHHACFRCAPNSKTRWGWPEFMLLSDLQDECNGFLVNDSIIVQAQIKRLSTIHN